MIKIFKNFSLKKYNTFGIDVSANFFVQINSTKELNELFCDKKFEKEKKLILGGGSNILFAKNFTGIVIQPKIQNISIISESDNSVILKVGAGVVWDDFVEHCVNNNWYGIENLSNIPGTVGACPIQNVGAYGVEVSDVIEKVEFVFLNTMFKHGDIKIDTYTNKVCKFSYRNSIFKSDLKSKVVITNVYFCLSKHKKFNIEYKGIGEELKKYKTINIKNIRKAIIDIRNNKLPSVADIGNVGSFFKNPIINKKEFEILNNKFPKIPFYSLANDLFKIPAAYLIDKSGFKGYKWKKAGVYEKQALILVNYGNSTGLEILELANIIEKGVFEKFGLELEKEVNVF